MERDTSVGTIALFASTDSPEILGRLRNDVVVKLHHYSPFQLSSYAYVKKASWPPHLSFSLYNFLPLERLSLSTDSETEEEDKQCKTLVPLFISNASIFKRHSSSPPPFIIISSSLSRILCTVLFSHMPLVVTVFLFWPLFFLYFAIRAFGIRELFFTLRTLKF